MASDSSPTVLTDTPLAAATQATACKPVSLSGTDVAADLPTLNAPSFANEALFATATPVPKIGERWGDFDLVQLLGQGGFASVFLAKQVSLGRLVALKIGPNRGQEARTLASLEHEHIVQVYSETVEARLNLRLLCMQYVPGTTLHDVLVALPAGDRRLMTGKVFLATLDEVCKHQDQFRPTALAEREALAQGDFAELTCWLGQRLALALDFAHRHGILHRDIKPANILLNSYGRPFLADFNLASQEEGDRGKEIFGGTLAYMAPEHLEAFAAKNAAAIETVDERSDIYGLGLVLYELLLGQLPFPVPYDPNRPRVEILRQTALFRKNYPPVAPSVGDTSSGTEAVLRRCLAPEAADRPQTAGELAQSLQQCQRFAAACRQLPPLPRGTGWMRRHPFVALLALAFFPNLLGSIVNIAYNAIHIVGHLTPPQQRVFEGMVVYYNGLAYPLLVGFTCWLLWRLRRGWDRLRAGEILPVDQLRDYRRQARFIITWSMLGTSLGWLPGGILFPTMIHLLGEPLSGETWSHFAVSFTISGLIAVTLCYLGSTWIVLRILYPVLWAQPTQPGENLAEQLRQSPPWLGLFQCLAGSIPLSGAMLMVLSGTGDYGDLAFRLLVCALIMVGMLGFIVAVRIGQYLHRVVTIWTRD